jgi:hypothetical protein
MMGLVRFGVAFGLAVGCAAVAAHAEPIHNPTAIFAGLDKTTGRIINFDVGIGETVQFGTLQVTPRICNTRPRTETPQTTGFVEVDELLVKPTRDLKAERAAAEAPHDSRRIFSGWMFAASPGLHGVEHPVYDVWLVDCKGGKETPAAAPEQAAAPAPAPAEEKKTGSRKVTPVAPAPVELQPIGPSDQPPGGTPPSEAAAPVEGVAPSDVAPEEAPVEPPKKKKKKQRSRPADGEGAPAGQAQPSGGGLLPF